MTATLELSYSDVSEHRSKKDLYIVVHDKVYNASTFVDEHPGGEEVLLDVGGQDATEAFEDVGHSDEAREILEGLLIGKLKRLESDPPAPSSATNSSGAIHTASNTGSGLGVGLYVAILVAGVAAFGAWKYMQMGSGEGN